MRIGEFREFYCRALPKRKRVLVKGKPGVGKTFGKIQACEVLGWQYIGTSAPLLSPVKVGGYPVAPKTEGGDATHALFDAFARAFRANKPTLLDIDDLGMANGETLKAIVDLVQFGRIDNRVLPDCVVIGASSNDVGHGADVQGLIEPLKTRWHSIIEIETNIDDVVIYGLSRNWPADLLAYLRNSPAGLHDWKPSKNLSIDGACPRGWEYVAEWVNDGFDDPEVLSGCVGKGRATEYLAFRRLMKDLPDIDRVLMDPEGETVPEEPSARYFVAMAIAGRMNNNNFGRCLTYLKRMPAMFRVFAIRNALKAESEKRGAKLLDDKYVPIHHSRDYTAWAAGADGKLVDRA